MIFIVFHCIGTTSGAATTSSKLSSVFGGKLFAGQRGFDPVTISMQIVSLQFIYYLTLSFSIMLFNMFVGYRSHLGQIFSPDAFLLSQNYSFVTIFANFFNILFMVLSLAYIVEKANKCLDFVLTTFIFHLLFTWIVFKFPNTLNWWVVHAIIITVTVLAAEAFCMKLEMAEIPLSLGHIIKKGKEIGIQGAQKIISKADRKSSKEMTKLKKKDKSDDV